ERRSLAVVELSIGQWNLEVFVDRQIVEQMILRKNKPDLLVAKRGPLFRFQMMNRGLVEKIFAAPTVVVHSEDVKQRRFSGAGGSHHRDEFAFGDPDVHVAQNIKEFAVP